MEGSQHQRPPRSAALLITAGAIVNAVALAGLVLQFIALRETKMNLQRDRLQFQRECMSRADFDAAVEAFALELQSRNPNVSVPLRAHRLPETERE
jgi:hypothetical protein